MHKLPEHSRIVVCGTARNVSNSFPESFLVLVTAFSCFLEVKFIVCESFSSDDTIEVLQETADFCDNFTFFSDDLINKAESRRTVRIASARTQIQSRIAKEFSNFDYVAMVDLDGVNRDLTLNAVNSIWDHSQWDAAFANQPLRYYDIWALRAKGWCEQDWFQEYELLLKSGNKRKAKRQALLSKIRSIPKSANPILVESAFGGLGIYKLNAFLEGEYLGADMNGNEICEHVSFHTSLIKKGFQLYIMPSLVNLSKKSQIENMIKEFALRFLGKI